MGTYLNPGNSGFARCLRSQYIDKTMLIDVVNGMMDSPMNLICRSCPRRFGKSYAAQMLCAYYDRTAKDLAARFCSWELITIRRHGNMTA